MNNPVKTSNILVQETHNDFLKFYKDYEKGYLSYYNGPMLYPIITEYGFYLRNTISKKYQVRQNLFYIFIELAQNVREYSILKGQEIKGKVSGIGAFGVYEDNSYFYVTMGNLVSLEQYNIIQDRYEKLNTYDRDEIIKMRSIYRTNVLHDRLNQSGNIGLINVALKSVDGLEINFYEINDHQKYYVITAKVFKN